MPLWHELARSLTGQALIDAVAAKLRANVPSARADDAHYQRRALAMLRQAGINPFVRQCRPEMVGGAAVREVSVFHEGGH